jgi:hypothetical protein
LERGLSPAKWQAICKREIGTTRVGDMKRLIETLAAVVLLSSAAFAEVTKEDLEKLAAARIPDTVVVAYVRAHGPMPKLSAQDLIELRSAGLSDQVLEQVAAAGDPKPASAPLRREVVELRVQAVSSAPVVVVPHVRYGPCRPRCPWVCIGFCW